MLFRSAGKVKECIHCKVCDTMCGSGDDDDQRICLINEEGKWLVYYCEDGDRMEVSEYADEAQACEDCLCRLSN